MPLIISHIDQICRSVGRDVLMMGPSRTRPQLEPLRAWQTSNARKEIIAWLDEKGIQWKPCGPVARDGVFESYYGDIYIDLPYAPGESRYESLIAFTEEDALGNLKWPNTRLYLLSHAYALENAHHDAPGYWEKYADSF